MNPILDPYSQGKKSVSLVILVVALLIIIGVVFILILKFKPETKNISNVKYELNNTPKERTETNNKSILEIYNLTNEALLLDQLFDELVYPDSPEGDRIKDFVSSYKDYASLYSEEKNRFSTSELSIKDYDSAKISFDQQRKFLENSIVTLLKSIDNKKKIFRSIPVAFPIAKANAQIISGFGMRQHPILDEPRMHTGIDIRAPVGTAVVATASGRVINTEEQVGYGYGRPCMIEHKFGYQTLYGHMVRLEVYKNKIVQKGDVIGRVGDTGLSQGPHLHYEVRKNGKPLNPSYFIFEGLTEKEYKEVIKLGTQ
jgi:murein DD-endopeptidase MepM/ murein hydrolase activator NlpD